MDDENIMKAHTKIAVWIARIVFLVGFSILYSAPFFAGYLLIKNIVYKPEKTVSFEDVIWLLIFFFLALFRLIYNTLLKKHEK
jgi:hypothetical protein